MTINSLQSTAWLAKRLGLSITTVERLRAQNSHALPQHITIGRSIKYDEGKVNAWIQSRLEASEALQEAGASHE